MDLGYIEYHFTWNNRRIENDNIQERLDKVLSNSAWRILLPQAIVRHLPTHKSDHKLIILHMYPFYPSRLKPFRFEKMWIRDPSIGLVISSSWSKGVTPLDMSQLMSKIKHTKLALKTWNRVHFGHV